MSVDKFKTICGYLIVISTLIIITIGIVKEVHTDHNQQYHAEVR